MNQNIQSILACEKKLANAVFLALMCAQTKKDNRQTIENIAKETKKQ